MTTNYTVQQVEQLALPVRSFLTRHIPKTNEKLLAYIDGKLARQFRAIENYLNAPHTTFGSQMVFPMFISADETSYDNSMPDVGAGTWLTYTVPDTPIPVEKPFRIFAWSQSELLNNSGTNAGVHYGLEMITSWGIDQIAQNSQQFFESNNHRYQIAAFRSFAGLPQGATVPPTLTMKWAYRQNSGGALTIGVRRQQVMYIVTYAPDASFDASSEVGTDVRWTTRNTTKTAYRREAT